MCDVSNADADRSAVFQDINILKITKVSEGVPHTPSDAYDIESKFAKIRQKFIGKPKLSFELVKLIVLIRRRISLEQNLSVFFRIVDTEIDFLSGTLSSRWLVSIADTYADHGKPVQQATAAMIVSLFNMVKLTESERQLLTDNSYDQAKLESIDRDRDKNERPKLWDGMLVYSIFSGDMPKNMITRMTTIASKDKVLSKILETLLERALSGPTILSRLAQYNPAFMPDDWQKQQ